MRHCSSPSTSPTIMDRRRCSGGCGTTSWPCFSVKRTRLWRFPHVPGNTYRRFKAHDAEVEVVGAEVFIRWTHPVDLAYFIYREVFLHELGHHHHNQYRSRNKHPRYDAAAEASADRHAVQLAKRKIFLHLYPLLAG